MNTYMICKYIATDCFYCLYLVDYYDDSHNCYKILEIIVPNDKLVYNKLENDGYYTWRWKFRDSNSGEYDYYYKTSNDLNFLMEFPDDESALLWFKMNY